jgi:hypothetical protein
MAPGLYGGGPLRCDPLPRAQAFSPTLFVPLRVNKGPPQIAPMVFAGRNHDSVLSCDRRPDNLYCLCLSSAACHLGVSLSSRPL